MPWDDPSTTFGAALPAVPREIQVRQLRAAAKLAEEKVGLCQFLASWFLMLCTRVLALPHA